MDFCVLPLDKITPKNIFVMSSSGAASGKSEQSPGPNYGCSPLVLWAGAAAGPCRAARFQSGTFCRAFFYDPDPTRSTVHLATMERVGDCGYPVNVSWIALCSTRRKRCRFDDLVERRKPVLEILRCSPNAFTPAIYALG